MSVLEEVSTITAKGQTTVPKAVRQVLGVDYGGQIAFRVEGDRVTVQRAEGEHDDPLVGRFLDFLAKDIEKRPETVRPLSRGFAARIASAAKGKRVNIESPIEGPVDL